MGTWVRHTDWLVHTPVRLLCNMEIHYCYISTSLLNIVGDRNLSIIYYTEHNNITCLIKSYSHNSAFHQTCIKIHFGLNIKSIKKKKKSVGIIRIYWFFFKLNSYINKILYRTHFVYTEIHIYIFWIFVSTFDND